MNSRIAGAVLFGAVVVFGGVMIAIAAGALSSEDGSSEATQLRPGELDQSAVDSVTRFIDFPVLWLGPEFEGYPLTSAVIYNNRHLPVCRERDPSIGSSWSTGPAIVAVRHRARHRSRYTSGHPSVRRAGPSLRESCQKMNTSAEGYLSALKRSA